MAIAKAQPTAFDDDAVQHKLEKLAEQILALTPEELETLEIMLNPELMEELLRRSREAREHPEELLTHEEFLGGLSKMHGVRYKRVALRGIPSELQTKRTFGAI